MEGIEMPEEMTFEQALKSLEEAVAQLEQGQMPESILERA